MKMNLRILTHKSTELINITDQVCKIVSEANIDEGICLVTVPHSTAGIIITSPGDDTGLEDLCDEISRLIPTRVNFKHQFDTPFDAAAHIKSAFIGTSISLMIIEGKLLLSSSQGLFFFEFDGGRERIVDIFVTRTCL